MGDEKAHERERSKGGFGVCVRITREERMEFSLSTSIKTIYKGTIKITLTSHWFNITVEHLLCNNENIYIGA